MKGVYTIAIVKPWVGGANETEKVVFYSFTTVSYMNIFTKYEK